MAACLLTESDKGRSGYVDAYETINNVLVHLFNDILELEERAVITEEFKDLTNNCLLYTSDAADE